MDGVFNFDGKNSDDSNLSNSLYNNLHDTFTVIKVTVLLFFVFF